MLHMTIANASVRAVFRVYLAISDMQRRSPVVSARQADTRAPPLPRTASIALPGNSQPRWAQRRVTGAQQASTKDWPDRLPAHSASQAGTRAPPPPRTARIARRGSMTEATCTPELVQVCALCAP